VNDRDPFGLAAKEIAKKPGMIKVRNWEDAPVPPRVTVA
jgi:hypothetical protein